MSRSLTTAYPEVPKEMISINMPVILAGDHIILRNSSNSSHTYVIASRIGQEPYVKITVEKLSDVYKSDPDIGKAEKAPNITGYNIHVEVSATGETIEELTQNTSRWKLRPRTRISFLDVPHERCDDNDQAINDFCSWELGFALGAILKRTDSSEMPYVVDIVRRVIGDSTFEGLEPTP
jgi:hypothetical protein